MANYSGSAQFPQGLNNALAYVDLVKNTYSDQPEIYSGFLDVMRDFRNGLITMAEVGSRVAELFDGHPELIEQFNVFLPPGHHA
ncbi:Transcriptional regulatory protein sin3 [Ceratobasidium sp. 394]|nr:Transcriptional regulatory protein sin3 [Ceratobasidium sp. 394]